MNLFGKATTGFFSRQQINLTVGKNSYTLKLPISLSESATQNLAKKVKGLIKNQPLAIILDESLVYTQTISYKDKPPINSELKKLISQLIPENEEDLIFAYKEMDKLKLLELAVLSQTAQQIINSLIEEKVKLQAIWPLSQALSHLSLPDSSSSKLIFYQVSDSQTLVATYQQKIIYAISDENLGRRLIKQILNKYFEFKLTPPTILLTNNKKVPAAILSDKKIKARLIKLDPFISTVINEPGLLTQFNDELKETAKRNNSLLILLSILILLAISLITLLFLKYQ